MKKYLKTFEDFNTTNDNSFDYRMLSRLQSDCEYFLNWGKGGVRNLYYNSVEEHIDEMKKLWNKLPIKPEWLSYEDIEDYEKRMLSYENNNNNDNDNIKTYKWISGGQEHNIKYHIGYDVFSKMYTATLLGGEFDNTYGQGDTEDNAVNSLKLRLIQLRNKRDIKI